MDLSDEERRAKAIAFINSYLDPQNPDWGRHCWQIALRQTMLLDEALEHIKSMRPYVHDRSAIAMNGPNEAAYIEAHLDDFLARTRSTEGA